MPTKELRADLIINFVTVLIAAALIAGSKFVAGDSPLSLISFFASPGIFLLSFGVLRAGSILSESIRKNDSTDDTRGLQVLLQSAFMLLSMATAWLLWFPLAFVSPPIPREFAADTLMIAVIYCFVLLRTVWYWRYAPRKE